MTPQRFTYPASVAPRPPRSNGPPESRLHVFAPELAVSFSKNGDLGGQPIKGPTGDETGDLPAMWRVHPRLQLRCQEHARPDAARPRRDQRAGADAGALDRADPRGRLRYAVRYIDLAGAPAGHCPSSSAPIQEMRCRVLVIAAGALGSPELMLRSASSFPGLSRMVGTHFSPNGDLLTFGTRIGGRRGPHQFGRLATRNGRRTDDHTLGCRRRPGSRRPALLPPGLRLAGTAGVVAARPALQLRDHGGPGAASERSVSSCSGAIRAPGSATDCPRRCRARESPRLRRAGHGHRHGRRAVAPPRRSAAVALEDPPVAPTAAQDRRSLRRLIRALGGRTWPTTLTTLNRIITVHPVGGMPMGSSVATGVVDDRGEVHGWNGLFVIDGSAMPGAVGPNPSMTIAAFALRAASGSGAPEGRPGDA